MSRLPLLLLGVIPATAQQPFAPPRLADGHPDLGGMWMAATFSAAFRADTLLACFQPGIPRAVLLPESFQLFQKDDRVAIVYQHAQAYRVIFTDGRAHDNDNIEFYMGDSRGHWEGNTLRVVERYTRTTP